MNAPTRQFSAAPAVRSLVPLLIGFMGPSGGGKTYSALRLATGIQRVAGGDIFVVDTEARRALHYADQFRFKHVDFQAPFGSLDYLAAVQYCVSEGAGVVIVDSMSHEHSGPGGYLLTQDAELDRMAGDDAAKRERVKMAAWIKPSALRQRMINGILQLNCNFIFCFRAKEKIKPMKVDGKTQPVELGFMPIAGEEMLFEQTVNCLLLPRANGVPSWRSDHIGERMMMKLPGQFASLFPEGKAIDEETGVALAEWAKGGSATPSDPSAAAIAAARNGADAFRSYWRTLPADARAALKPRIAEFQKIAEDVDATADDPFSSSSSPAPASPPAEARSAPVERAAAPVEPNSADRRPAAAASPDDRRTKILADLSRTGAAAAEKGRAALDEFLDGLNGDEQALLSHAQVKAWRDEAARAAA
jgi:hypothetical protein